MIPRQGLELQLSFPSVVLKIVVLHVQSMDNIDDRRIALTLERWQRKQGKTSGKEKGSVIKPVLFPISTSHARISLLAYLR